MYFNRGYGSHVRDPSRRETQNFVSHLLRTTMNHNL